MSDQDSNRYELAAEGWGARSVIAVSFEHDTAAVNAKVEHLKTKLRRGQEASA